MARTSYRREHVAFWLMVTAGAIFFLPSFLQSTYVANSVSTATVVSVLLFTLGVGVSRA